MKFGLSLACRLCGAAAIPDGTTDRSGPSEQYPALPSASSRLPGYHLLILYCNRQQFSASQLPEPQLQRLTALFKTIVDSH